MCTNCLARERHDHPMEKMGFGLDEGSPMDLRQIHPQKARQESMQRFSRLLAHACHCKVRHFCRWSCEKLKRVVEHTMVCGQITSDGCSICKQLFTLCCYHAKECKKVECLVPLCPNIKRIIKHQQKYSQRYYHAYMHTHCNSSILISFFYILSLFGFSLKGDNCIQQCGISLMDQRRD